MLRKRVLHELLKTRSRAHEVTRPAMGGGCRVGGYAKSERCSSYLFQLVLEWHSDGPASEPVVPLLLYSEPAVDSQYLLNILMFNHLHTVFSLGIAEAWSMGDRFNN